MSDSRSSSPMDPMQAAVARARQQGDGDIGKTDSPVGLGVPPAEDDNQVLSELGLKEDPSRTPAIDAPAPKPKATPAAKRSPDPAPARERAPAPSTTASARSAAAPAARVTHSLSDNPKFSSTRTVRLDPAVADRNRVIAGQTGDRRVEVYRQLRAQILGRMRKHQLRNFAITSAHEDAGKTLTAVNLAISMSMELNQTVLLVDLDLRTPGVHSTLGVDVEYGIIDHLQRDDVPLNKVLFNPGFERLVVLPGRPAQGNLSELLTSPAMRSLIDDLMERYQDRMIIFDLPPLLRNDDAMAFLPKVDACLFVIEDDVTTATEVQQSMRLLADTRLLGTILNKAA